MSIIIDGQEVLDLNQDIAEYKGRDLASLSAAEAIHFAKANKSYGEPGVSYEELEAIHKACEVYGKRPAVILETGMCFGTSTRYWLWRLAKYGGELHNFEIKHRQPFVEDMKAFGLWDKINKHGHSMMDPWDKQIDILFIDSEHALSDALGEYMRFRVFLKSDGIVGFHDSDIAPGVRKALEFIQEIDDLELISEVTRQYSAGVKFYRIKCMNRYDRPWQKEDWLK